MSNLFLDKNGNPIGSDFDYEYTGKIGKDHYTIKKNKTKAFICSILFILFSLYLIYIGITIPNIIYLIFGSILLLLILYVIIKTKSIEKEQIHLSELADKHNQQKKENTEH